MIIGILEIDNVVLTHTAIPVAGCSYCFPCRMEDHRGYYNDVINNHIRSGICGKWYWVPTTQFVIEQYMLEIDNHKCLNWLLWTVLVLYVVFGVS